MKIENLLHNEIESEFDDLKSLELGTEKYKTAVDGLTKLVDKAIELDKINIEYEQKEKEREIETDLKIQQMEDEKKDRLVRNGIAIGSIVVPTLVTIWGTIKSINFEKEGTITTIMGRGFINKLLPKK